MKKFLRGVGIALMIFNGIGFASILATSFSLLKDMEAPFLFRLLIVILMLAFFGGLFLLGYRIWSRNQEVKQENSGLTEPRTEDAAKNRAPAVPGRVPFRDESGAEKKENAGASPDTRIDALPGPDAVYYTVIASYLELPFHDGDSFFLFEQKETAEAFLKASGRQNLYIRELIPQILKRELSEYLICGYKAAIVKKTGTSAAQEKDDIKIGRDELIRHFELPGMDQHGSIAPEVLKRMHNYLNQLDYTARRYGQEPVPEFWQKHLKNYKDDVIRGLLETPLCLPTSVNAEGKTTISVLPATFPNGDQWASLFTDSLAIMRYLRKTSNSMVFPGLLSDIAKDIRSGRMPNMKGIMINPGREEFKVTVQEIEEQEKLIGKLHESAAAEAKEKTAAAPVPQKAESTKAETKDKHPEEMRGFFKGLLPGEKESDSLYISEPDKKDVPTEGYIPLGALGGGYGWSLLYFDPYYRRFLEDEYSTGAVDDAETRYNGRISYLPEELLKKLDSSKDKKAPAAAEKVRRIIAEQTDFAAD